MTTTEAAAALHITPQRVRTLIYTGRLPAAKVGRDWQIAPADLAKVQDRPNGRPRKAHPTND